MKEIRVLVITGSENDLDRMRQACEMLDSLGIGNRISVASAHRDPGKVEAVLADAEKAGVEVIIAGAGMSAALPGVVASLTNLPVIGVPLDSGLPGGIDALLSIAQMPTGIPVATVAVNGAKNAAVLSARILALKHPEIAAAHERYRNGLSEGRPS